MTDVEQRVLDAVLEFAEANDALRCRLELWGKSGFSRFATDAANIRATLARERFQAVSAEYRQARVAAYDGIGAQVTA